MAATPVQLDLSSVTGNPNLTLRLFALDSDVLANPTGGGDAFVEATNRDGTYIATVDEALAGTYLCKIDDGGDYFLTGYVVLADTTDVCIISAEKPAAAVVQELSEEAIAAIADGLLDLEDGVEADLTLRMAFRGIVSALFGKISGVTTNTPTFRDLNDTKDRISANVSADGRLTIVLDLS